MHRFAPSLKRVADALPLPQPQKSRIMLEMAADLEALYGAYRARGVSEEEAVRRAEVRVLADPETLQKLTRLHTTGYRRWLNGFSGHVQRRIDFLAAGLAALLLIVPLTALLLPALVGLAPNPYLWPVLAVAVLVFGVTGAKAYTLFLKRDHDVVRLHDGLPTLLFLTTLSPVLGAAGVLHGVRAMALELGRSDAVNAARVITGSIGRESALLALALLVALVAAAAWFLLVNRVAAIERAEVAYLLDG
jgi:hypothetical protein